MRRIALLAILLLVGASANAQFSVISRGPLTGGCNPRTLGLDAVNNVLYTCGDGTATSSPQWSPAGSGSGTTLQGVANQIVVSNGQVGLASPAIFPAGATISGQLDILGNSFYEFYPDGNCGFYGNPLQDQLCDLGGILVLNRGGAGDENLMLLPAEYWDLYNNPPPDGTVWAFDAATQKNRPASIIILTNPTGRDVHNAINFRGCQAGGINCGTHFQFQEDPNRVNKQDYLVTLNGDGNPFYMGNVLNSTHPGICFGGPDAMLAGMFCIDRSLGFNSHLVRYSSNSDMWGTVTLASGTASYSFNRAFASAPGCLATWQSGTLTGILKCLPTTSGITVSSTVGTDNAVIFYQLLGNPN